ncbi:PAS domain-containing sensor histidine kinase [Tunturiibacter lichenicola]|uniref:PAS domain-containing sensor histidine kinase n=1 Tax=Tunturiibacter lichenicola TaxID=2051959 RepID=UPI0021B317F6|nr:PAS domain-containing protein [Edaphobacter lichenicola]
MDWSEGLLSSVNLMLACAFPSLVFWGEELVQLYNDAFIPLLSERHPSGLGQKAEECWSDAWQIVGPNLRRVMDDRETVYHRNAIVPIIRDGRLQDIRWTYSYSPIFGSDGAVLGVLVICQDITREVGAAQDLRESETRASRILQSIGDAVIVTDPATRVTQMNSVAEQLTGWKLGEAKGELLANVFQIVNETTRQPVESPADKVRSTGSVVGLANHTVLISKDGRDLPIDDSGAPILDERGALNGIVLVFRDIEERRAVERERDPLTERLTQVLGATTDAIVGVDRNWVMTYLNPKATEVYASDRQILGRNIWGAFPDAVYEGSPYVEHYYRAMNERVSSAFDAYYPAPLNLWLHIDVYPTPEGIVTFSRDITDERNAREALKSKSEQAERQLAEIETVYRTAPIGLALFDTQDFRYLRLNDRQAEFFGLKPEQVVGRTLTEMAPIKGLKELFEQVLAGQPVVNFPLEGELVTRPGEHRYWTVSYFPVIGADGAVQAISAASLEITQQKKAELALMQSEKLAVVGRLASSIAHEINNPLESVTNLLYLAERCDDMTETRTYVQTAERELRRVSVIVNQTLRFHKQSTSPQEISGDQLIDSIVSMFQSRIINYGIRVEERKRIAPAVRCFEGEIRQVLSNLVSNAIDAMQPLGGGRLLLRSRVGRDWNTRRRGLIVTVADTGNGMSASVAQRIFEPFYTTKGISGTGLGLWVSSEIVLRHRGTLRFRTSERYGRSGTVFSLFLPFDAVTR